ncbi:DAK2 domain-containing protein [Aneurinibacillus terranovensis]|uniref:DAK2 domain-containing protein n=1 Tax=Aneurinibacillus terranovensis TaxID=278991 RepID=UPI0009D75E6A
MCRVFVARTPRGGNSVIEKTLNGQVLRRMFAAGANCLEQNAARVNALNVFPVPDGDTGTNMNLTFRSGIDELNKSTDEAVEAVAAVLSRGLLLGARGNSGVILSQLFRGFAKGMAELQVADAKQLAHAFVQGVDMAYKAVLKPVEGTILTVAREAANAARNAARYGSVPDVLEALLEGARKALANTPNQLPVLKEVGVVDSGGQGLVYIYEGFVRSVDKAEPLQEPFITGDAVPQNKTALSINNDVMEHHHINPAAIQYGYCTEFMVHLTNSKRFSEESFREQLSGFGDSLLVVSDADLVKVHIHAEEPGRVLTYAQKYGMLDRMKIENMRLQHEEVLKKQEARQHSVQQASVQDDKMPNLNPEFIAPFHLPAESDSLNRKPYEIVTVAAGKGIEQIFKSLGADIVIEGGQTMNPSAEQFVKAIDSCQADNVIILPNNKNIIMAAEQAAQLVSIPCEVIPSLTIPQGMSALLAFDPSIELGANKEKMRQSLALVKTGHITYAVRDTTINEQEIHSGDFMGIVDGAIVTAAKDIVETARNMLVQMVSGEDELITVIYGEDVNEPVLDRLVKQIKTDYPEMEVEIHNGKQPLYSFIIAVE